MDFHVEDLCVTYITLYVCVIHIILFVTPKNEIEIYFYTYLFKKIFN